MKIKEKVLKEVLSKINRFEEGKEKLYLAYRRDFEDSIDLTLAEVGKEIDKRKCCFKDIKDYRELKKEIGI